MINKNILEIIVENNWVDFSIPQKENTWLNPWNQYYLFWEKIEKEDLNFIFKINDKLLEFKSQKESEISNLKTENSNLKIQKINLETENSNLKTEKISLEKDNKVLEIQIETQEKFKTIIDWNRYDNLSFKKEIWEYLQTLLELNSIIYTKNFFITCLIIAIIFLIILNVK